MTKRHLAKAELLTHLKYFFILFTSSSFAQVLNFLSLPALSRLYSPAYFGEFTVFLSTTMIIGLVSCGRLDVSIQTTQRFELTTVRQIALIICSATTITFLAVLAIASLIFSRNISIDFIIFAPLTVLLIGFSNTSSYTLLAHEDYKRQGFSILLRTIFVILFQMLAALSSSINGLILGLFLGYLFQSIYLHITCKRLIKPHFISLKRFKAMFSKYFVFVKYDVLSQLFSNLAFNSISFFLMFMYGASLTGYFGVAYRLIAVPVSTISSALAQTYLQKAAAAHRSKESFYPVFKINLILSLSSSVLIFTCILLLINRLLALYLGEHWQPASAIAIGLIPFFAMRYIYSTISPTPLVIKKPNILLVFNVLTAVFTFSCFLLAYELNFSAIQFVNIFSIVQFPLYMVFVYVLYKLAQKHTSNIKNVSRQTS